jgi:MoaA/NifB/PqqE/SkfB family radical SAM enzyme
MRSSDDIAQRPVAVRTTKVDLRLFLVREGVVPLRAGSGAVRSDVTVEEIVQAARTIANRPGSFVIAGGDPLRRVDLLQILGELTRLRPANLGLQCSGRGLSAAVVSRLQAAGVQRIHLPFHSARQDAHDWLVGESGALKTVHRAIRACVAAKMAVVAEVIVTRPTMLLLAETVDVLTRLGVRTIYMRRLNAAETDGVEFVPLSPRLELLAKPLEQAAAVALERRARLVLRDFPVCVAPRLRPLFAASESEVVVTPDGCIHDADDGALGCANCPGLPQCGGAPADYVSRFGWEEFIDPLSAAPRVAENVADQRRVPTSGPMTFGWRGPRRVRCEVCAETGLEKSTGHSAYESTRVVRARLVQAARHRPSVLRLVGADLLAHPQAAALMYDALRLFKWVEAAGEASAVVDYSDLDLRRLKELKRLDVTLFGPDAATHDAHCGIPGAFAAMQRGVERLRAQTQIPVGAYAIVHDARMVPAFADAWSHGALPGEPRFRLSERGGSLEDLIQCAIELPPGPARAALLALLPRCGRDDAGIQQDEGSDVVAVTSRNTPQQRIHSGRSLPYEPCGADPIGAFELCPADVGTCTSSGCPGTPRGWQSTARSKRWSNSI